DLFGHSEARRRQRDSDRGRDEDLAPLEVQRLGELHFDAHGDRLRGLGVGHVLEEEAELVTAEPRHGVAGTQRAAEAVAHLHQQLVADRVTKRVVDHLEAVEVEEKHGQVLVAPLGARETALARSQTTYPPPAMRSPVKATRIGIASTSVMPRAALSNPGTRWP